MSWRRASIVLSLLAVSACAAKDDGDADGGDATMMPSGGGTVSTTGDIEDPEAFCARRTEQSQCNYADETAMVYCEWVTVTPVQLDGGTCMLGDPIGSCLAVTGATTAAGCAPSPGCDGEPFFREVDGEIRVSMQCGGSPPVGYEPCTFVEPGLFDPAACGCLCDEPLDTTGG